MKHYFFAYLFVRLNKLAAFFVVLAGICVVAFLYTQTSLDVASKKYQSNDLLNLRLVKLSESFSDTIKHLTSLPKSTANQVELQNAVRPPLFEPQYTTSVDFANLHDQLIKTGDSAQAIKKMVIVNFDSHLADIINKLQVHARQVAPADETNGTISSRTGPHVASQPESLFEGLFASSLSKQDIEERVQLLRSAKEYLLNLEQVSENPENKQELHESTVDIDAFLDLMPTFTEESNESSSGTDVQPQPQQTKKLLNAEKVALQLSQLKDSVEQAVLSSWSFDEAYDKALEIYSSEREKCTNSEFDVRRLWRESFASMTEILLASVVVAFVLLVLSDLISAILDTAVNTQVVSSAYQQAAIQQE